MSKERKIGLGFEGRPTTNQLLSGYYKSQQDQLGRLPATSLTAEQQVELELSGDLKTKKGLGFYGRPTTKQLLGGYYEQQNRSKTSKNKPAIKPEKSAIDPISSNGKVGHGFYGRPTTKQLLGGYYSNHS